MYKKVVKFSFKRQKIFWVLVFSFMYLLLVDAMDRSLESGVALQKVGRKLLHEDLNMKLDGPDCIFV